MNRLPGKCCRPQEKLGVRTKCAARIRNNQPAPGTRKQPYSERILKSLDASAHCWLADAKGLRGAMKAAKRRHREKGLNLVDFHSLPADPPNNVLLSQTSLLITILYRHDRKVQFDRGRSVPHNPRSCRPFWQPQRETKYGK